MNFENLSDDHVEAQTKDAVRRERQVLAEVLEYLREVYVREIYLKRGYGSIFDYAVKELGYSAAAAGRRTAAMHMMRAVPEVAQKIEEGTLNLSNVARVQAFCRRQENLNIKEDKREILKQVENTSREECERILMDRSPEAATPPARERILGGGKIELRIIVSEEQLAKFQKAKALRSHTLMEPGYLELFEALVDEELTRKDPARKRRGSMRAQDRTADSAPPAESQKAEIFPPAERKRKKIPAAVEREVWARDSGECQHCDPRTGRKCGSTFQVQSDHIVPVALGGENTLENLQLTCRAHNIHRAREKLGERVMGPYARA